MPLYTKEQKAETEQLRARQQEESREQLLQGGQQDVSLEHLFQEQQDQNVYIHRNMQQYGERPELAREERKLGLSLVYGAVEQAMPHAYDSQKKLARAGQASVKLHHGRGTKLMEQGRNVLEFDISGSGYQQFPKTHRGYNGHGKMVKDPTNRKKTAISLKDIQKGPIKIKRYHRIFGSWVPGVMSVKEIERKNELIRYYQEQKIDGAQVVKELYGEHTDEAGLQNKHVLVKSKKQMGKDGMELEKRRVTMAGPLAFGGTFNQGDYKIDKLKQYMLQMGEGYLKPLFEEWKEICYISRELVRSGKIMEAEKIMKKIHPVSILLKGHSRGAVAMGQGAMMIKYWINKEYPEFDKYVKFETINYDPVPGFGNVFKLNRDMNITDAKFMTSKRREQMEKGKMMPLGKSAETTVIYSLQTQHSSFFTPQMIHGAKRVILTPYDHAVGLTTADVTQQQAHRAGYTDAKSGEVYRNSGINELDTGFYIVDENRSLVKIPDLATARQILDRVLKKAGIAQLRRQHRMYLIASEWFRQYGNQ